MKKLPIASNENVRGNLVLHDKLIPPGDFAYTGNPNVIWIRYPTDTYNFLKSHGWVAYSGIYADKSVWMKMERPQ